MFPYTVWLSAGGAGLMEEDGASLNPLLLSSAGSESSSAPLMLPDGFNWSPLARSRAQESLPTNGVCYNRSDNSHALECTCMHVHSHGRSHLYVNANTITEKALNPPGSPSCFHSSSAWKLCLIRSQILCGCSFLHAWCLIFISHQSCSKKDLGLTPGSSATRLYLHGYSPKSCMCMHMVRVGFKGIMVKSCKIPKGSIKLSILCRKRVSNQICLQSVSTDDSKLTHLEKIQCVLSINHILCCDLKKERIKRIERNVFSTVDSREWL